MLATAFHQEALKAYRAYNDSPMQQRLRQEAPIEVGVVYWNPQQDTEAAIRHELKRMRETGFTCVRFHCIEPIEVAYGEWDYTYTDLRMDLAQEYGLKVYPSLNCSKPSELYLQKHGIDKASLAGGFLYNKQFQDAVRHRSAATIKRYKDHPALAAWTLSGEPHATGVPLTTEHDRVAFKDWLQEQYADPAAVHQAWLIYPDIRPEGFGPEGRTQLAIAAWDDAVDLAASIKNRPPGAVMSSTAYARHELFGANRDLLRFRADSTERSERLLADMIREYDDTRPICVGNHQLLYANGELAWDQHKRGRSCDMHFSSIHLSWHFEPVLGEVDRPHYMQSRLTSDVFKGGYTNCYETTGGPVQYSGGYGNHMDAAMMRKLMVSFLAAGNEGSAFWAWNTRPGGIEAGEYGMLSLSGEVTEWAHAAGEVTRAMERCAKEIWNWEIDPELAIVRSWDTESVMTSEPRRFDLQDGPTPWSSGPAQQHIRGLVGASRAAIDGQVDFQYLTTDEILAGLAGVYPAIYLPHVRCIGDDVLEALIPYVEQGGHLIADVQIAFEDQWGKVRYHQSGDVMDRLFGGWIDNIHDARTRQVSVDGLDVDGFYGDIKATHARVIKHFDTGKAAMTEYTLGQGRATLIGWDSARMCWEAGQAGQQQLLADIYRGGRPRRWQSDVPMTFRRRHADADHYFVMNDGPARQTVLRVFDAQYSKVEDMLTGAEQSPQGSIVLDLEAHGGMWLRCQR